MKSYLKSAVVLFSFACFFISCKKNEDNNFYLQGSVVSGADQQPLANTQVTVKKQVIESGVYGSAFTTAASALSPASGSYNLKWPMETFAALKLIAEKDQYITREISLNVSSFSAGNTVTQNVILQPEAFVEVHIQNNELTDPSDELLFTFTNAQFDCYCCKNEWRTFQGTNVDSTFQCKLYGETWLKYQTQVQTPTFDTIINDSVWCPAFQTTTLNVSY
jgi:hypothetical protein